MPDVEHTTATKICTKCHVEQPATTEFFQRRKDGRCKLYATCISCKNQYNAQHYQKNRDARLTKQKTYYQDNRQERLLYMVGYYKMNRVRILDYLQEYRQEHPRKSNPAREHEQQKKYRALKKGAAINDFTREQWIAIQEQYDHRCVYCGNRRKGKLTQDHIIPLSKGGNHTLSNIVPACRSCNSRKQAGPPLRPVQPLLLLVV